MAFREIITQILDEQEDNKVAISWCPDHKGIPGNERADYLPEDPECKCGAQLRTRKYVLFGCSESLRARHRHLLGNSQPA